MDIIKVTVEGTVTNVPAIGGTFVKFPIVTETKGGPAEFTVYLKKAPEETIDIHKEDKVFIVDAGLYVKDGINLTAGDDSRIFVIRRNNNEGYQNGKTLTEVKND